MKIDDIEEGSRPREKIKNAGSASLSNIELLAIVLGSGSKSEGVIELSTRLIKDYGLSRLFYMSYNELISINGIKDAKATRLMALFEISRRIMKEDRVLKSKPLRRAIDFYDFIKDEYLFYQTEVLKIVFVNKNCEVLDTKTYMDNDVANVSIPFRDIVNHAINLKAYGIFMSHNHPSGDTTPSYNDIEATRVLLSVLDPLNITFFDHIIIGKGEYYSFMENKTLELYN